MVSAKLQGGLGNYMFQIAAAHTLAVRNNDFAKFNFASAMQVHKNVEHYKSNIFRNVMHGECELFWQWDEPSFTFNEIPYKNGLLLNGYFQSEKYLDRDEILNLFEIPDEILKYLHEKYGSFEDVISIHIRRGDYLHKQDRHPVLDMDYYETAIHHFDNSKKFYIFTDDVDWCKERFSTTRCQIIQEKDYIDLWMMSLCEHNIIANSSFSWWGAWLNKNPDKIVIAPNIWFGPKKKLDAKDLVPKEWIRL